MFRINTQSFAQQEEGNEQACSTSQDISNKGPADWLSGIWKPLIKYTPADIVIPYTLLPDTLDSWKDFKKNMEDKYGTSIGIVLDDHHQQILNGPGARKGRNIFWWNLTVKQRLWKCGNLVFKARGSNTDGNPPNGITPSVGSRLNLDWAAY